ncbi:DNA-binding transcriptional activator GcvA [compost metagenome]
MIGTTNLSPRAGWRFGLTDEPTLVRIKPRLSVTSNDGAIAAATAGLGIARLLSYQVADEVANGTLQVVLAEYEEAPWPIHVLHRESRYGSAKVRTFIDMLVQELRAHRLD